MTNFGIIIELKELIEGLVKLQTLLAEKVLEQEKQINALFDLVMGED